MVLWRDRAPGDDPMFPLDLNVPIALDITTLVIVATCITVLLGLLLLSAWAEERIPALAWWGGAYLLGGSAGTIWSLESMMPLPLPWGTANALLFVACGMIWSAARLFLRSFRALGRDVHRRRDLADRLS